MTISNLVVLDRDGVLNADFGYVHRIQDFKFVDGIIEFCQLARSRNSLIVIATNQAGIARGLYSESDFHHLTMWMTETLKKNGVDIFRVLFCPHHPDFRLTTEPPCRCRKPNPGMLFEALEITNIKAAQAVMIGDKESDLQAGKAAEFKNLVKIGRESELSTHNFSSVLTLLEWSNDNWFFPS